MIYTIVGVTLGLVCLVAIGRTDFWRTEVVTEDFFFYVVGWLMRLVISVVVATVWPVAIIAFVLCAGLWLTWAGQQQRRYIKRYGKPNKEYDWHKFIPSRPVEH